MEDKILGILIQYYALLATHGLVAGKFLGEGTFGQVYMALHQDKHCVLKVIKTKAQLFEVPGHELLKKLPAEVRKFFSTPLEVVELGKEHVAFALTTIPGAITFTEFLGKMMAANGSQQEQMLSKVLQMYSNILIAVHNLHINGLVHRDLKTDNIIVHPETCEIMIIDNGSVCETDRMSVCSFGTPSFWPTRDKAVKSTPKQDIYALHTSIAYTLMKDTDKFSRYFGKMVDNWEARSSCFRWGLDVLDLLRGLPICPNTIVFGRILKDAFDCPENTEMFYQDMSKLLPTPSCQAHRFRTKKEVSWWESISA